MLLYWFDARAYLIDKTVADIGPWTAVAMSAGLLVLAWLVYDVLCRLLKGRELILGVAILGGTALAAWGNGQLFSPRAAWLQTGAMLGTVMAASVLFNIIPAHWELIRAKEAGREPDPAPGIEAKRRSVHNNYLTLPVVATMLAGHFSFLTGRQHAWLILLVLMIVGAWVRHFYNLRHAGRTHWWMLGAAAAAITVLAVALIPDDAKSSAPAPPAQIAQGKIVFQGSACVTCHTLADAGSTGTVGPNLDQAKPAASLVLERVTNGQGGMPPFKGKLSGAEIAAVAAYVSSVAGR